MARTKDIPTSPKPRPYRETPVPPPVLRWPAATGPSPAQAANSHSSLDNEDVSSQEEGEDSETSGEDSEGELTSEESSPTQTDHSHQLSDNDNSSEEEESEESVALLSPQAQQLTPGQTIPQIHTPAPASPSFFAKLPATLSTTSSSTSYTSAIPPIDPEDPTQAKMDSNRPAGMSEEEYQQGLKQFDIEKASLQDLIKQREIMKFRMKGTDAVIEHLEKKLGWNNGKTYGENMEELLNRQPTPPPKKVNPNKNKNKNANRREKAKAAREAAAAAKKQVEDWTEADMNAVEGSGEAGGLTGGEMGATQGSGDVSGPESARGLNEELSEKKDVGPVTGKWKFAPYGLGQNGERVAGDENEDVEMDG